jgi:hypothetical protein
MRTKTVLLSALLGALGSVSAHAQNVYSLNAVGYINITCLPGFNMISCPLLTTDTNGNPNNSLGAVLPNSSGALTGCNVYFWFPSATPPAYVEDSARVIGTSKGQTLNANGWGNNGTNLLTPGVGCWFQNNFLSNITLTIVGTVPTGPITNTLVPGFNLVGSAVPMSGDLASNTISALTNYNIGDNFYTYNSTNTPVYAEYTAVSATSKAGGHGYNGNWAAAGDPIVPNVGEGFWYQNNSNTVHWVENYSVNP